MKRGRAWLLGGLLVAAAGAPRAGDFGRLGVAVKTGESAGIWGAQVAYNFSPHLQACVGRGGIATPMFFSLPDDPFNQDSYFCLGKYYLRHVFFAVGYSRKTDFTEIEEDGAIYRESITEHGLPFHAGYEFGFRKGFYFSTSIGYLYIPGGGGRSRELKTPVGVSSSIKSAESGPSAGLTLGYYLF